MGTSKTRQYLVAVELGHLVGALGVGEVAATAAGAGRRGAGASAAVVGDADLLAQRELLAVDHPAAAQQKIRKWFHKGSKGGKMPGI